ncbi:iodotyrosine deiodinase [Toxorhynchites rutilus septentrionalis]|uniref:iodotyrosine deiodinase n=1 Tax=Toxorhynchites rutilus septentrionalis TaxID=329112 RepID=UPI00247A5350|nr:iodotyrosine deiodinase [Toxorhynchites rutilus septentrionalis]
MNFVEEILRAFDQSLIISCWKYIFPVLVVLYLFIFLYDKHRYGGKAAKPPTTPNGAKEKLDGIEYVGEIETGEFDPTPELEEREHIPFAGAKVTLDKDPIKAANHFYEIVNDRRSVRKFSRRPVDVSVVERCIHAAGTGPSGAHTEPWTFCLVSDPDMKLQVREIIEAEEFINYEQRMSKQWTTNLRPLKTNHVKEYLTEAPHLILIFKQTYGIKQDGGKKQHYYNEISTSIATGILLCALQAAGLNTLVTTPLNCGPALRNLLGRPLNEKLLVLLPVGYAADDCTVPDLKRKQVEDIIVKY